MQRLFALLDAALADPNGIDDFRTALHQLAGTAAFFGKADLGTLAATLDEQLGDPDLPTPHFLATARTDLRRAAAGAV